MKRTPLARKTPIRKQSGKLRRVARICSRLRCRRPAARGLELCLTHARAEADRLFSLIVRSRGVCFRCGTTQDLQASHTVPRSYLATRWMERACECACRGCHRAQHMYPLENEKMLRERLGFWFDELRRVALEGGKPDYATLLPALQVRWASIQRDREVHA